MMSRNAAAGYVNRAATSATRLAISSSATPASTGSVGQPSFSFFGNQFGGNELGNQERQGASSNSPERMGITVDVKISESEITSTQSRVRRAEHGAQL
jgi:hypothetical protein